MVQVPALARVKECALRDFDLNRTIVDISRMNHLYEGKVTATGPLSLGPHQRHKL